jgi:hypothetical protein
VWEIILDYRIIQLHTNWWTLKIKYWIIVYFALLNVDGLFSTFSLRLFIGVGKKTKNWTELLNRTAIELNHYVEVMNWSILKGAVNNWTFLIKKIKLNLNPNWSKNVDLFTVFVVEFFYSVCLLIFFTVLLVCLPNWTKISMGFIFTTV